LAAACGDDVGAFIGVVGATVDGTVFAAGCDVAWLIGGVVSVAVG
jgi:hypothetical protein